MINIASFEHSKCPTGDYEIRHQMFDHGTARGGTTHPFYCSYQRNKKKQFAKKYMYFILDTFLFYKYVIIFKNKHVIVKFTIQKYCVLDLKGQEVKGRIYFCFRNDSLYQINLAC